MSVAINTGDTAWVLISSALVALMTPGLALFYGGMVQQKNLVNTLMKCFVTIGLIGIQWVLFGYTLSFGPDVGHLIGNLKWLGFKGVGLAPHYTYAATIPHEAFAVFQMMFAVITPALIIGGLAERVTFKGYVVFTLLWSTLIYDPLAHWVWADGGWLHTLGVLDFAGGTVVHISAGIAGLVAALYLGPRKGYGVVSFQPHNVLLVMLGAGLLWFGWFGFNAGSALGANDLAAHVILVTNTAAAAASLSWMLMEWRLVGKPTLLGLTTGAVTGLVAITPAAGYVAPISATLIGLVAGVICFLAVHVMKSRLGYDDALDAFGAHGIGGIWGAIATGIFYTANAQTSGGAGILANIIHQSGLQMIGVAAAVVFSAVGTLLILKLVEFLVGLRVGPGTEENGLDAVFHGEEAYAWAFVLPK
jgi:Amt family ammonium transporter